MDTIAIVFAAVAVVSTAAYLIFLRRGANSVRDISATLRGDVGRSSNTPTKPTDTKRNE